MSVESSTSNRTRDVTVQWGKLEFHPTRKGDEVCVGETDLLAALRRYEGKEVHITIQEVGYDFNQ